MTRYPPASEITPSEFEAYVADVLAAAGAELDGFAVEPHVVLSGVDGDYDFDAVAAFDRAGMKFKIVIEAKRHKDPIKRELVQVLHSKMVSVGAQKALLVAAGRFQSGAIEYALKHGIALAELSEGRLSYETRSQSPTPELSPEQAREVGFESYISMVTTKVDGAIEGFRLSPEHTDSFAAWIAS